MSIIALKTDDNFYVDLTPIPFFKESEYSKFILDLINKLTKAIKSGKKEYVTDNYGFVKFSFGKDKEMEYKILKDILIIYYNNNNYPVCIITKNDINLKSVYDFISELRDFENKHDNHNNVKKEFNNLCKKFVNTKENNLLNDANDKANIVTNELHKTIVLALDNDEKIENVEREAIKLEGISKDTFKKAKKLNRCIDKCILM